MTKPPADLKLETLKEGVEITTINKVAGEIVYRPVVWVVKGYDPKIERWRYMRCGDPTTRGAFPNTGVGHWFMQRDDTPKFWYSANPEHIKIAKEKIEIAKKAREAKYAARDAKIKKAAPIGDLLGCGNDDCHITEELAESLTDEQIETLKGWLDVK